MPWSTYFAGWTAGLRCQSGRGVTALVDVALGPGAHHADVEDPRVAVLADFDVPPPLVRAARIVCPRVPNGRVLEYRRTYRLLPCR